LKRSNRLVLLVGVFLAVVAFVGIALILSQGGKQDGGDNQQQVTKTTIVVAAVDIPLGSKITSDKVTTAEVEVANKPQGSFGDTTQVIGQVVTQSVVNGQAITAQVLFGNSGTVTARLEVPVGKRAMAIRVDQVTGVGTVIKPGDYVDMLVGFTGDKFPVVTLNPQDESVTVVSGLNSTSVKLLLQGMQVLATLLPPPPSQTQNQNQGATQGGGSTSLNDQQEIVLVAVSPQQAEVIKFAQLDGNISLVLRSGEEFLDPVTGEPIQGPTDPTTGVVLKVLVDDYGVLVPELVEALLPQQAPTP
jgi:pilus assembly protein CpaB